MFYKLFYCVLYQFNNLELMRVTSLYLKLFNILTEQLWNGIIDLNSLSFIIDGYL